MKTGIASEILEQKLKSKKALENPQMLLIEENTINPRGKKDMDYWNTLNSVIIKVTCQSLWDATKFRLRGKCIFVYLMPEIDATSVYLSKLKEECNELDSNVRRMSIKLRADINKMKTGVAFEILERELLRVCSSIKALRIRLPQLSKVKY